jgi:hypothetical protein
MPHTPVYRESDSQGLIRFDSESTHKKGYAFVFAKGFAIDLFFYSLERSRTVQLRMQRESEVRIELVDVEGKPIQNARVSPGTISFREAAAMISTPNRLPADFESRTDANGKAMLHGVGAGIAKTNEDGIGEVRVQEGEWYFSIERTSLPAGYCIYYPERISKLVINEQDVDVLAPALHIGRGRQLKGRIEGVDLKTVRFDWINVERKKTSENWSGNWSVEGDFSIVVPDYLTLEEIEGFDMVGAVSGKRGTLSIESREPMILRWTPR